MSSVATRRRRSPWVWRLVAPVAAAAAAAAVATTAVAAATTAAVTTTAAAVAVATTTAAAAALLAGASFADGEVATAEVGAVQSLDGFGGIFVGHFDEAEAARASGLTVGG